MKKSVTVVTLLGIIPQNNKTQLKDNMPILFGVPQTSVPKIAFQHIATVNTFFDLATRLNRNFPQETNISGGQNLLASILSAVLQDIW